LAVSNRDKPTLIIESNVWDMTWILNKASRLVEKYEVPITVTIEKSNSVEVQIILGVIGGAAGVTFVSEVSRLLAHDLYYYVKGRIYTQRTGEKPPKRKPRKKKLAAVSSREKGLLRDEIQKPEKEIKMKWNDSWEKEGLPTDKEDERQN
jgi:hypothetical protein